MTISIGVASCLLYACDSDAARRAGAIVEIQPDGREPDVTNEAGGGGRSQPDAAAGSRAGKGGKGGTGGGTNAGKGGRAGNAEPHEIVRPDTAEPSPARSVTFDMDVKPTGRKIYTRELHGLLLNSCGNCHATTQENAFSFPIASYLVDGDFKDCMNKSSVPAEDREKLAEICIASDPAAILASIATDDDALVMPPPGAPGYKKWSERTDPDPIRELYKLLEAWYDSDSPLESFVIRPESDEGAANYRLSEDAADAMSNLGTSVPHVDTTYSATEEMDKLDELFAEATELPSRLDQTDLTSLDSEALAGHGVFSFAPGYPLFSDDAHKNRYVRVPRGKTIAFDAKTQSFAIPANTRFYKTFLKPVLDAKTNTTRYRKIETRIIVSRPADSKSGTPEPRSLFGTYAWDENETSATLVTDPRRNGTPFLDRLVVYATDEVKARELAANTDTPESRWLQAGVARTYAIPGSDRCIQCHRGTESFVLGFTPLQIKRRETGDGGSYDPTGPHELDQLERLVDYGVISGVNAADDILSLEDSQGSRKPRNDLELRAQAYLVGNCANCHNPIGFPSVQNPVLKDLLNFLPDSKSGGIFQFPLDRVSPRISRDGLVAEGQTASAATERVPFPYISPSIVDYEPDLQNPSEEGGRKVSSELLIMGADGTPQLYRAYLAAPWRSLIYRVVDTPYVYFAEGALIPHMPLNAVGFDTRLPGIIGDWMVSIPSRSIADPKDFSGTLTETVAQPYEEVKTAAADYDAAKSAAELRLDLYHSGGGAPEEMNIHRDIQFDLGGELVPGQTYYVSRFSDYQPVTSDIVDPKLVESVVDVSISLAPPDTSGLPSLRADRNQSMMSNEAIEYFKNTRDGVPDRAHWVVADFTEFPGDWAPRRSDWRERIGSKVVAPEPDPNLTPEERAKLATPSGISKVVLSDALHEFALEKRPFGKWTVKPDCDLSNQPKAPQFRGEHPPEWFAEDDGPTDSDPLYMWSPGEMVYNEICVNCHGEQADSRGRMAETLMLMTGGKTRVANFRDGMFGPIAEPDRFRTAVFDEEGGGPDDWSARYMAWMALGGTKSVLDRSVLAQVSTSQVLGKARRNAYALAAGDANMLSIAKTLCGDLLPNRRKLAVSFIRENGDYETWARICSFENPLPVTVFPLVRDSKGGFADISPIGSYRAQTYPKGLAVLDHRGVAQPTLASDNFFPHCFKPAATPEETKVFVDRQQANLRTITCPPEWLSGAQGTEAAMPFTTDDEAWWPVRGAINAGFSAFVYIDDLMKNGKDGVLFPTPAYDKCEELKKR